MHGCQFNVSMSRLPAFLLFLSLLPDYLALAKTRLLLRVVRNRAHPYVLALLILADVVLSMAISFAALWVYFDFLFGPLALDPKNTPPSGRTSRPWRSPVTERC
jgi:hypothetical protein